jgi:hypothetical protein
MAREKSADVDVPEVEDETTAEAATPENSEKEPKKAKEPARGDLPEGYVTPVGLSKVLGEKGLQKNREGEVLKEVKPQMVYSYIKNAPKEDPFPIETVTDSIGKERQAVQLDKALDWWNRKNERTASRKENAAAKEKAKADKAAAKAAEAPADDEATEVAPDAE